LGIKAQAIELDSVTVDGVDLPPQWNRIFEPRPIRGYDLRAFTDATAVAGAESLAYCFQCGKCTGVCPVNAVGDYSPRKILRRLQLGAPLTESPDLWLCATCGNCLRVCPKLVDMISAVPALREQALLDGWAPKELASALESSARYGNPLGESPRRRADWARSAGVPVKVLQEAGAPVDVLWFVECYPSYHPRGRDAAVALARILHALSVDFGILGPEERCAGDSQRLAGERGLFEQLAEQNIRTLAQYEFQTLLVTDPHAYNAFLHEYPRLGGVYHTLHYTQFLAQHLPQLPLRREVPARVTFHDPCYLGRHNGEYEAPRQLLSAIPGLELVEMGRSRAQSFCCGGGGGGMWLDGFAQDHESSRLSEVRVLEAIETGAEILAVACPYEVPRFEDAVKSTGSAGRLKVMDVSELLALSMGLGPAGAEA